MANFNLGQDVANKREKLDKSFPLKQAVGMRRYGSLININPSGSIFSLAHARSALETDSDGRPFTLSSPFSAI